MQSQWMQMEHWTAVINPQFCHRRIVLASKAPRTLTSDLSISLALPTCRKHRASSHFAPGRFLQSWSRSAAGHCHLSRGMRQTTCTSSTSVAARWKISCQDLPGENSACKQVVLMIDVIAVGGTIEINSTLNRAAISRSPKSQFLRNSTAANGGIKGKFIQILYSLYSQCMLPNSRGRTSGAGRSPGNHSCF